jgi:hypothetical protein
MLLRPPLIAAAVAMVPIGWAATSYAQVSGASVSDVHTLGLNV